MKQETNTEDSKFGLYFELPNQGLRAYFERVESGQPDEYRTTFYRGKSLDQVLEGWASTCNELEHNWPSLLEFENDLRQKVGPLSIMLPLKDRMKDIDSYYDAILLRSKPIDQKALDRVISEWGSKIGGLRLRGQDRTVREMRKSTNSGSPFFTKRRTVVDRTYPCSVDGSWQELVDSRWRMCAVLGWRGQEGGPEKDDVKQRVVWMFPFALNICELQFYQPLIAACQRSLLVPAWVSMDAVDEEVTEMFRTKGSDPVICTDFSKFDQHFNSDLQVAAQSIFSGISTDAAVRDWLTQTFPIKFDIPLAYDWGKLRFGPHGMASGSGGTNADETAVHRALQYEAAGSSQLNPHSQCLGDDGMLTYPGITVEEVLDTYSSHGQEMNKDKQYVSTDDVVYLRRWHHKDYTINNVCVGVYSTYRALGRLCEQERYYSEGWNNKMVALRQLSILENVKWHPLREEFVDYCMAGDKYRLGLDIPGFFDNLERLVKESVEHMPDFLGYTKSMQSSTGINTWWIVQYLKSKA